MEKVNKLEQIFWDEGKFYMERGKELNPKPIGKPISMRRGDPRYIKNHLERFELPNLIKEDKSYQEVNAYLEGNLFEPLSESGKRRIFFASYSFYKI